MFRPLQGHHQAKIHVTKCKNDAYSLFRRIEISKLARNFVFFLLGNSPVCEFYLPTQKKEYDIRSTVKV